MAGALATQQGNIWRCPAAAAAALSLPYRSSLSATHLCMQALKLAKKAAKRKQIKRGVKEVIKAIRKNVKGYVRACLQCCPDAWQSLGACLPAALLH